ncbi:sigma-70 family RNA polymerase sigma factor [Nocardioides dilutus]
MIAPSDAQLVSGVLAGDPEAFAQVYDRYADRLHDFAYSMLRHREDAADAVADAFVTTAERLDQLRDPERLRPWLYAVVRRECLRRLKARSRTAYGGDDELLDLPDQTAAPETVAEQESLRALVWEAAGGLNERDRAMLDLHLRQGLDGAELGEAMGMSADNAYVGLSRLRDQVERSIGALLVARTSRDDCTELTAVLDDWDGAFTPLVRKRVARHVDRCRSCTARRVALASPAALLAGVPAFAAPLVLRDRVLQDTRLVSALASRRTDNDTDIDLGAGPGSRPGKGGWRDRRAVGAVLALLLAVAGTVGVVAWHDSSADEPARVGDDLGASATDDAPTPDADQSPVQEATQVEPPTLSPTLSPSGQPTSSVSVTPTEEVSPEPTDPATDPSPSDPAEPTATAAPGRLVAAPRTLSLGTSGGRSLTVSNTGGTTVSYAVEAGDSWLSASPAKGTLKPGQSRSVSVSAQRAGLPEGSSRGRLTVRWDDGTVPIAVTAARETPPTIGAVSVVRTDCGQGGRTVVIAVPVDDESGVASASVVWNGPTVSGTTALTASGGSWAGPIGPFAVGGTVQLTFVATDSRGNTARRNAAIEVDPCPQ